MVSNGNFLLFVLLAISAGSSGDVWRSSIYNTSDQQHQRVSLM